MTWQQRYQQDKAAFAAIAAERYGVAPHWQGWLWTHPRWVDYIEECAVGPAWRGLCPDPLDAPVCVVATYASH